MNRPLTLLALLFLTTAVPQLGCKKEVKEEETSEKEEKSEKSDKKKKKAADDEESSDDEGKSKKKKKAADDEESEGDAKKLSKLGMKKCDLYIEKMQECAEKANPKAAADGILSAAKSVHKAWKEAAETPAAKKGLETTGCPEALKAGAKAYKSLCKGVFDEFAEEE